MISKIKIQNFRSIKDADITLGKITVLTGANNSGKSSIIYAMLALKNTISNPNQSIDNCLTLPFINLGGFQQIVYRKKNNFNINVGITFKEEDIDIDYDLSIGNIMSSLTLSARLPVSINMKLDIAFPYPANKSVEYPFSYGTESGILTWNGIHAPIYKSNDTYTYIGEKAQKAINKTTDAISKIDFVPLRRGFIEPFYGRVPLGQQISSEKEIATMLTLDGALVSKVADYLEKIVDRIFLIYQIPNIDSFSFQTIDKQTSFTSDLVNEGLGTNQLVTILAKCLQKDNKFICIDEPEIHLHPTIIDKLVSVLIEISEKENKQFLISTHSEHFINSLLTKISSKEILPEDVKVYYLHKDKENTIIENQEVNIKGQIKGGLKNFYATELSNIETFFKITD